MSSSLTRRELVAVAGAISAGTVVQRPVTASTDEVCTEIDSLEAEVVALEDELAALENLVEELPTRKEELFLKLGEMYGNLDEPQFPPAVRDTAHEIGESIRDSVVVLDIIYGEFDSGFATAWVVDDGYLLTNAHNVDDAPIELRVVNPGGETYSAEIVNYVEGQRPDVALLKTDFPGEPLSLGSSSDLDQGDYVVQVGHPGDFGYWVISLGEFVNAQVDILQATVPGLEGNSGSPIVDFSGEVVGMTYSGTPPELPQTPYEGDPVTDAFGNPDVTNAVPIETAMEYVEEWR